MSAILILVGIGIAFGIILGLADRFCHVDTDERVDTITSMLPQINCGACGFPGCAGLAEAIVNEEGKVSDCRPIKEDQKQQLYVYIEGASGPNGEKINLHKVK